MKIVRSVRKMQGLALGWKRAGRRVGFVPTMGYLHAGHLSLVKRARRAVGPAGLVVLSIYVNPTQFAPHEDLAKYPRDLARDQALCKEAGVDYIFLPETTEIYPPGYSTFVVEETLSRGMEGSSRPAHFRGVTTIVAKLFNLVLPDVAVFGAKDFQQAAVIRRMIEDLNFPLKLIVSPTVREKDRVAISSRNKYLSPEERKQAAALSRALNSARALVARHGSIPSSRLQQLLAREIEKQPSARVDYIAFFDPESLEPVKTVKPGDQMALAVFVGKTRLIDNGMI